MFKRPTVFVVGAGASFDYGLPLGGALAASIATDTDFYFEYHTSTGPSRGDRALFELLRLRYQTDYEALNRWVHAGQALASALSSAVSVDDALYQLNEMRQAVDLGKVCIIRSILKAESGSALALRDQRKMPRNAGKDGWIEQLFSMAIQNVRQSALRDAFQNVTFINFNYDRCIEHYIYWSFQRIGLSEPDAATAVRALNMIRPYGGIGSVIPTEPKNIPFGLTHHDPFSLLDRIRTYTESDVLHDRVILQEVVTNANLVIFLGFGFHTQNMELLRLADPRGKKHTMATVKKVNAANLDDITQSLATVLRTERKAVELYDMTAAEMLRELRLKIMLRVG